MIVFKVQMSTLMLEIYHIHDKHCHLDVENDHIDDKNDHHNVQNVIYILLIHIPIHRPPKKSVRCEVLLRNSVCASRTESLQELLP